MSEKPQYSVDDLKYLMSRLRDPTSGCPWDLQQTYQSIVSSTIEEAYEVVDAIEQNDMKQLRDELGDLLFQVIFYSQLGREDDHFDFDTVAHAITDKLIRRHPHVFPTGELYRAPVESERETEHVNANWEAIKKEERNAKGQTGVLDDVPLGLPALTRAQKLQKRASGAGFDWQSLNDVFSKLDEEISELQQAIAGKDDEQTKLEIGDLLFTVVNIARLLKFDAESCLRAASHKFIRRIEFIEAEAQASGGSIDALDDEQRDSLWQVAKSKTD